VKVVVVGSVNLDVVVRVPHLPAAGETVLGVSMLRRSGGKGANQAVAAARLGAPTALIGAVGADPFGDEIRGWLAQEPVDIAGLVTIADRASGLALINVDPAGENTVTVAPGANACLEVAHERLASELAPAGVLLLQLEIPTHASLAAARTARELGVVVVLNAAPVADGADPGLAELLREVDVLVVNETEARELLAFGQTNEGDQERDWAALASGLRALGPRTCVVTLGEQGAVVAAESKTFRQPAFPVDVVDTTGAGDAFCGALGVAFLRGDALIAAIEFGCAAAALAVTRIGAQAGLPRQADVERLLSERSERERI
jgi:ribokinase